MTSVLIDGRMSDECERALSLHGFYPIRLPSHPSLPTAISSHPDSLIFYHHNTLIAPSEYCEIAPYVFTDIRDRHPNIKLIFSADELGGKYPLDCKMNAKIHSGHLFARQKSVSEAIKDYSQSLGYSIVNVSQGYPACSSLTFGSAAITADAGMHKAFLSSGIDSYLVETGGIILPPYEYGFIGGASGVYKDKIYFIGDYNAHPSASVIKEAAERHGFTPVSLTDLPLTDLGGLIFLE